ncbi:MAG: hypothetical protein QNJ75_04795 [Acidimicrobiia bacterium]|nr:hypothetical protein [Acidimicrobiia bacterium]
MTLRRLLLVVAVAVVASACGRLGTGLPACGAPPSSPNAANVLSVQALPEAAYAPCLNSLELDWDEVEFSARSGLVRLEFERGTDTFLDVRLTATCDIGDAKEVRSGQEDVTRYEDVVVVEEEVRLTIVPDGERPLAHALGLASQLNGSYLEDRPLVVIVDVEAARSATERVGEAAAVSDFVWIIGDIDVDEGTLAMRPTAGGEWIRGIELDDALDEMEDMVEDIQYRGNWYLVFDGGCITYDFDTEGKLAVSIARQADAAIGLYRNSDLIDAARDAGFEPVER